MLATRARIGLLIGLATTAAASTAIAVREPTVTPILTAEAIMDASLAAQGGRARMNAVREWHIVEDITYDSGDTALMTTDTHGDRMHVLLIWPGGLDYVMEIDGDTMVVDQGAIGGERDRRVVTGDEDLQTRADSNFPEDGTVASMRLVGQTVFEGEPAYEIDLAMKSGVARKLFISQITFLPIGTEREQTREPLRWEPASEPTVETLRFAFSDYREVHGILVPFVSRQTQGDDPRENVTARVLSFTVEIAP